MLPDRQTDARSFEAHDLPPGWKRDVAIESCGYRPAIRPGLVLGEEDGLLVVKDPVSEAQQTLAAAQTAVFLRANGSRSLQAITRELAATRPLDTTEDSVRRILCALLEGGLLVLRRT